MTLLQYTDAEMWNHIKPQSETWRLDPRNRSGGEGLEGDEQVVSTFLSRWTLRRSSRVRTRAGLLAARRLIDSLEGRVNFLLIGPCDCRNAPITSPEASEWTYSDTTVHDDGFGWGDGDTPAETEGDFTAGMTTIRIAPNSTTRIDPGVFLGLENHLYRITNVIPVDSARPLIDVTIKPRLRTAVADHVTIEWCKPKVPMSLTRDNSAEMEEELARFGTLTLEMIEA